ncbi:hypothetical protein JTE90_012845 [Oedothorax gibbosus]|uniref:Uncharacterized protein n=1 Tax=Oedothorax gibbosus TaxID=931172 RepID=A0AAV6TQF5_9ARAC|nr:hypothetical protein JTE90_012845 [Oedothorax gibbosus]
MLFLKRNRLTFCPLTPVWVPQRGAAVPGAAGARGGAGAPPPPGSRRLSSIGTVNFSLRRSSVPREGHEKDKKTRADSKSCTIM